MAEGDGRPEGALALALLHLNNLPNECPDRVWCDRFGRCYAKWLMRPGCADAAARHPEPGSRGASGTSKEPTSPPSLPAGGADPP